MIPGVVGSSPISHPSFVGESRDVGPVIFADTLIDFLTKMSHAFLVDETFFAAKKLLRLSSLL